MTKMFTMKARRAFRLPDGTVVEKGHKFSAGVRSRHKDQIECYLLQLPEQMEEVQIPCQFVMFYEGVEEGVCDGEE